MDWPAGEPFAQCRGGNTGPVEAMYLLLLFTRFALDISRFTLRRHAIPHTQEKGLLSSCRSSTAARRIGKRAPLPHRNQGGGRRSRVRMIRGWRSRLPGGIGDIVFGSALHGETMRTAIRKNAAACACGMLIWAAISAGAQSAPQSGQYRCARRAAAATRAARRAEAGAGNRRAICATAHPAGRRGGPAFSARLAITSKWTASASPSNTT